MKPSGIIVSVQNNKGGVGKTACVLNLSHALALKDYKVLSVDLDSQSNLTKIMLPDLPSDANSLYELLTGDITDISRIIYETPYKGVSLLPNVLNTGALEPKLYQELPGSYLKIRDSLREYAISNYDFILIDTPPNLGFWVISALYTSDCVLVPVEVSSDMAFIGLNNSLNLIKDIQENGNSNLNFLRLLINKVDRRTQISRIAVDRLTKLFNKTEIFKTTIPVNTTFQQAEKERESVIRLNPSSHGAKAYRMLADEFVKALKARR